MRRLCLALVLAVSLSSCAGNPAPILVANSAVAVADSVAAISNAGKQLQQAAVLSVPINTALQQQLLAINTRMQPLPDLLRTIDRLQQAGSMSVSEVEKAIAILQIVGQDISVTIGGVPMSDATKVLIDLVRAAQKTVQTVLIEVAKIRGRQA